MARRRLCQSSQRGNGRQSLLTSVAEQEQERDWSPGSGHHLQKPTPTDPLRPACLHFLIVLYPSKPAPPVEARCSTCKPLTLQVQTTVLQKQGSHVTSRNKWKSGRRQTCERKCQKQGDKLSRVLGQNYFPSKILHSTEVSIKCEDRKKMFLNPLLGNKQNKSFNKIKIKKK